MEIEAPKNNIIWVSYVQDGVTTHVITSNILRTEYYLYKVENGELKKTRYKSEDPTELEKKIK
jgi:hypothetical protein